MGFTPCGVAFGALRKTYTAPCHFHQGEGEPPNRIIWYRVPDNRRVYSGLTVFFPGSDVADSEPSGPYEQTGNGRDTRIKTPGFDIYSRPGLAVDGDADDFLGRSPASKHFLNDVLINPIICLSAENLRADLDLDGYSPVVPDAALELTGSIYNAPFYGHACFDAGKMRPGVVYSLTLHSFEDGTFFFPVYANKKYIVTVVQTGGVLESIEFQESADCHSPSVNYQPFLAPIPSPLIVEFNDAFHGIVYVPFLGGFPFGCTFDISYEEISNVAKLAAELELDGNANAVTYAEQLAAELELDALANVVIPAPEQLAAALDLSAVDKLLVEPTPGTSCTNAPVLTPATPYTYDIPTGATFWFKWGTPPLIGGKAHINLTNESGSGSVTTVIKYGTSCSFLSTISTNTLAAGASLCVQGDLSDALPHPLLVLSVQNASGGTLRVHFRENSGVCP